MGKLARSGPGRLTSALDRHKKTFSDGLRPMNLSRRPKGRQGRTSVEAAIAACCGGRSDAVASCSTPLGESAAGEADPVGARVEGSGSFFEPIVLAGIPSFTLPSPKGRWYPILLAVSAIFGACVTAPVQPCSAGSSKTAKGKHWRLDPGSRCIIETDTQHQIKRDQSSTGGPSYKTILQDRHDRVSR